MDEKIINALEQEKFKAALIIGDALKSDGYEVTVVHPWEPLFSNEIMLKITTDNWEETELRFVFTRWNTFTAKIEGMHKDEYLENQIVVKDGIIVENTIFNGNVLSESYKIAMAIQYGITQIIHPSKKIITRDAV